jgi:hypothetical protein
VSDRRSTAALVKKGVRGEAGEGEAARPGESEGNESKVTDTHGIGLLRVSAVRLGSVTSVG